MSRIQLPSVIVPELFRATGGVQVFSRRMIEALDAIFGCSVPVISRNDRTADCPSEFLAGRRFEGCGHLPGKLRRFCLISKCISADSPSFLSTHPHFAPWLRYQQRVSKQPFLCVVHGIDVWNIAGSAIARGLEKAECVLPVSEYTANRLSAQLGEATPPLARFPNSFDETRFYPDQPHFNWRHNLGIPGDSKMMLSVCRVSKTEAGKGYDKVLEQMPRLLKCNPGLTWVLGGRGDDLQRLESKADELGVWDRCRFPGFIPDEHLPDLYRSADLFVLPSKKEGFGIVFLEAAACGLPVIAGNRDGSVDALANGELGTLIDPESPLELVEAINKVLAQSRPDAGPSTQNASGDSGRRHFVTGSKRF